MTTFRAALIATLVLGVGCSDPLLEKRRVEDINVDNRLAVSDRKSTRLNSSH